MKIRNKLFHTLMVMAMVFGMLSVTSFTVVGSEPDSLPVFTEFTSDDQKIGGLYVEKSDRDYNTFGGGTRTIVDLKFPVPSEFGATNYTLQCSTDNGSTWNNYQQNNEDVTTTGNNFSISFEAAYHLRLLVNGGPKNGYTSNVVVVALSNVDTTFSGFGLDESVGLGLPGVMAPFVGRGLKASFAVNKLDVDNTVVEGFLTYQWYRVNPLTYQMTEILGATNLQYITTEADVGYILLIRASGDGINVGGYRQILSPWEILIPNNATVSNVTNNGFTLNLAKTVNSLTVSDLTLFDKDGTPVVITSVTPGANQAVFTIATSIAPGSYPLRLSNDSDFWRLVSSEAGGHMMMEGVEIAEVPDTADTSAPVITLNGEVSVSVANGAAYTDAGVTITDDIDTGLTAIVSYKKEGNSVVAIDTSVAGTYVVHYNVSDTAGNPAAEVTRTVIVETPLVLPLTYQTATVDPTNLIVTLTFSKDIFFITSLAELKNAITVDVDGLGFKALNANDTISINAKTLVVNFDAALPVNSSKIKIAADSLKDSDNNVLQLPVETGTLTALDECFIATAAFGSKNQSDVVLLRHFRDQFLLTNPVGKSFVQTYYHYSPRIAQTIAGNVLLQFVTRVLLLPLVVIVYMLFHPVLLIGSLGAVTFLFVQRRRRKVLSAHTL